jgi:hypothetical protein
MSTPLGLLGALPDALLASLREHGYDLHPATAQDDVVLVGDRSDPNDLPRGPVVLAICDSLQACAEAYRTGASFAVPRDAASIIPVIERARAVAANQRAVDGFRSATLAALEREAILAAMKAAAGSTARAAAMLDISVRKVQYKLHEYGVPLTRRGATSNGKKPVARP